MSLNDRANSELWNTVIREALIQDCENELSELNIQIEKHDYSDEFYKAIRKMKFLIVNKSNVKATVKITKRLLITVAVMMGIVFGGLLTQSEVYAAVQNVVRSIFDTHDRYTYQGYNNDELFDKEIRLDYVPDGYVLRTAFYSESDVLLTYESTDEKIINFSYGLSSNSSISIDNEFHNYYEYIQDEITFYFYQSVNKDEYSTLIWFDNKYYYSIDAQLSKEEFVKMAESL